MSKYGEPWKQHEYEKFRVDNSSEWCVGDFDTADQAARAVACVNALAGVDVERFAERLAELRADAAMGCLGCRDDDYEGYPCPPCDAAEWLRTLALEAQ